MDVSRRWHVDAWSVRDGMAFASYRPSGGFAGATRTVFIGMPTLEVVPLGSISPALWATRANFQDRLHSENGEEIGFQAVEQVQELVRRGYLAGGIGPGGEDGGGGNRPPPDGPKGSDGHPATGLREALEHGFRGLQAAHCWRFAGSDGIADPERRRQVFDSLLEEESSSVLLAHVRLFATAAIVMWGRAIQASEDADDDEVEAVRWIQLLITHVGLWDSPLQFHQMLHRFLSHGDTWLARRDFDSHYWPWVRTMDEIAGEDMLVRIPCPLRPHWDKRIQRLADKALLAVASHDYFDHNNELPELVPAILFALTVTSMAKGQRFDLSESGWRRRLKLALDWLSDQMPKRSLGVDAETVLTEFAWGALGRR